MKYNILHVTRYAYDEPATLCHNQAHLSPREFQRQKSVSCKLEVAPAPAQQHRWIDAFGNTVTYFSIEQSHRDLNVTAYSQVDVLESSTSQANPALSWEDAVSRLPEADGEGEMPPSAFTFHSPLAACSEEVRWYAAASFPRGRALWEGTLDLTQRIHSDFRYDTTATNVNTPPTEVLERRRGVCQDFAHLQIACLRSLGLAARYVSGYLVTRPPPGKPRLVGADATHAWLSVYFPDSGWVDFDPTNNRLAGADYITLAWGRDYGDVSPIRGVFLGGGAHTMSVSVDVAPVVD